MLFGECYLCLAPYEIYTVPPPTLATTVVNGTVYAKAIPYPKAKVREMLSDRVLLPPVPVDTVGTSAVFNGKIYYFMYKTVYFCVKVIK